MKRILFFVLTFTLFYFGCVDTITTPTGAGTTVVGSNPTITIKYPLTNDTLQLGNNEFLFEAKDDVGVRAVELWVDDAFKGIVNYDGTTSAPSIIWVIDSTYFEKKIKYFLRVYDTDGKSVDSPVQSNILVATVIFPPNAPTNLVLLKLSNTIINLSWKHDYKNVNGFTIYKKKGATGIYTKLKDVSATSFNTNDSEVDPTSVFFYKIVAYNAKGESTFSNEVTTGQPGTGSTLAAPTNIIATAYGSRKIVLTWQDNSDNENFFRIERKTLFSEYQSIGIVPANVTTFKDSGYALAPSTDYYYRLKAVSNNDSVISSEVSAKTFAYDLLTPLNLRAINHNSNTIRLVWTDNNTNEALTIIERRSATTLVYSVIGSVKTDEVQFDDQDVTLGLTYHYRIRVTDNLNYSEYTNEISATPQSALILSPSNLQVYVAAGNVIKLTWMDNSNNETNFIVERASDTALTNFVELSRTNANIAEFDDASTVGGKTYSYRIRATDGVVFSGYSNVYTIRNPN